ncbi:MAG: hypothetical protein ACK47B_14915 [Armatimonadota bacterium]
MSKGLGGTGGRGKEIATPELRRAWQVMLRAALAGAGTALLWLALSLWMAADPKLRLAMVLFQAGYLLLRSLIAYGVYFRVRWAAWLGGVVSGMTVISGALSVLTGNLNPAWQGNQELFVNPAYGVALSWADLLIDGAFLTGIWLVRRARRAGA